MVLRALCLIGLAACSHSLFDQNPSGDDDMVGDSTGPSSCPATCLGDGGADFDGTTGGKNNHWQYLDDHRNRTWAAMTASNGALVGADPANKISSCSADSGAAACSSLPGALLVSTSGATSAADPAIAFSTATAQIIKLDLSVRIPSGGDHTVWIYRNSREDVLFTGKATAGTTLTQSVTVDALPADRFLVAIAPTAMGAANIGVQLFVSATGAAFPATCELAVPFSAATGNTVANVCGSVVTHMTYNGNTDTESATPPTLAPAPYPELGMATDLVMQTYFETSGVLNRSGDTTTQLWIKSRSLSPTGESAWAFSDLDLDSTGGLGIAITNENGPVQVLANTCTNATTLDFAGDFVAWPTDGAWHFVRVVHTGGNVKVCLDGKFGTSFPVPAGKLQSTFHPYIGKNVEWTPAGAYFDGQIDDVRVFSTALPCSP